MLSLSLRRLFSKARPKRASFSLNDLPAAPAEPAVTSAGVQATAAKEGGDPSAVSPSSAEEASSAMSSSPPSTSDSAEAAAPASGSAEVGKKKEKKVLSNIAGKSDEAKTKTHNSSQPFAAALAHIEKSFGKGSLMRLGDTLNADPANSNSQGVISTGSLSLDLALGIGGLPKGRMVEIFGPESSGKTTLALHVIAEAQKKGGKCVFIDAENALDTSYAQKLGVDVKEMYLSQPDSGEQALEIADTLVKSGTVSVIVIDSVAALVPRAELAGEMGDVHMGLQARMMSQALRKMTSSLAKTDTLIIFLNQIRMKIGVMFGNPETTPGGHALRYYTSVRMDIRRSGKVTKGEDQVGNTVRVKVIKNKLAPPFKEVEMDIMFGKGFRKEMELVGLGVQYGLVKKAGAWYAYKDMSLGQGREGAANYIVNNKAFAEKLESEIRAKHMERGLPELVEEEDTPEGEAGDEKDAKKKK